MLLVYSWGRTACTDASTRKALKTKTTRRNVRSLEMHIDADFITLTESLILYPEPKP